MAIGDVIEFGERIRLLGEEHTRYREALELITRECQAMNKGPVAVMIANKALFRQVGHDHPQTYSTQCATCSRQESKDV